MQIAFYTLIEKMHNTPSNRLRASIPGASILLSSHPHARGLAAWRHLDECCLSLLVVRYNATEGLVPCEIYFYLLASTCWSLGPNKDGCVAVTDRSGDVALANCGPLHPTALLDAAQRLSCKIDSCTVQFVSSL